jgi:hypothetical protein
MSGHSSAQRTRDQWRQASGLKALDLQLSASSATCNKVTWDSTVYQQFISVMSSWWDRLWSEQGQHKYRKLRFATFQKKQRAFHTIAEELCDGRVDSCVILWGNGSFGPTSRGHASAPNKLLRRKLADHDVEIHLVDERNTSKYTGCCQEESVFSIQRQKLKHAPVDLNAQTPQPLQLSPPHRLRGLLYCKAASHSHHQLTHHILNHHSHSGVSRLHHHSHGVAASISKVVDLTLSDGEEKEEKEEKVRERRKHRSDTLHRITRPWNRDVSAACNIFYKVYLRCFAPQQLPECWVRKAENGAEE